MKLLKLTSLGIAAVVAVVIWRSWADEPSFRLERSIFKLPAGAGFSTNPAQFSVSPDGRQLAVNVRSSDGVRVWTSGLDGAGARPVAGTEGVASPAVWSPDSRSLAFVSDGHLRRVAAAGGTAEELYPLVDAGTFDWGEDETILMAAGGFEPIRRISSAAGGLPQPLTRLNIGERHLFPKFVPGQRRFLFFVKADPSREGIWLGSFDGGIASRIVPGGVMAAPAGRFLLYSQDQTVVAQRFDPATLAFSGAPAALAEQVRVDDATSRAAFSVSASSSVLVFQDETDGVLQVVNGWPALVQGN